MSEFLASLRDRYKAAAEQKEAPKVATKAPQNSAAPMLADVVKQSIPDAVTRNKVWEGLIGPRLEKLTHSVDIGNWRFQTLFGRWEELRNRETPWLNFLESRGIVPMMDYQIEFREWNQGDDEAGFINVEGTDLGTEYQSIRTKRSNTMGCVAMQVNVGMLTAEMFRQQIGTDFVREEIDGALLAIRRFENSSLHANDEVIFEDLGFVPQYGGFITRSDLNALDLGGASDLTRDVLQGRVDAVANNADPQGVTYATQLVAFTNARQLQVLRDIIISEYNGINPQSRMEYEDELITQARAFGVNFMMAMEFIPGMTIGFALDSQLPSGTTILFDPTKPRLAKFRMGGAFGPFVVRIPNTVLRTQDVAFDLLSLVDPQRQSRSKITGHL